LYRSLQSVGWKFLYSQKSQADNVIELQSDAFVMRKDAVRDNCFAKRFNFLRNFVEFVSNSAIVGLLAVQHDGRARRDFERE
jgi:hypothetical protein